MDALRDIITFDVQYCTNSNVDIKYNTGFGWIEVRDGGDFYDDIFIQGDEAYAILDEAERLFYALGDITYYEALCHLIRPYIENLWA